MHTIKIQIVNGRIFFLVWGGGRGFDVISVCPIIDYGQQPMKMLTDVALLYKYNTLEIINNNEVQ